MDNLVFEESVNAEIDQSEFISKKWIYVNDNNSQNYTSQVVIDSTPLSNAGGYINWSEGYIVMPLLVQLQANTATNLPLGTKLADHSWAFKSGFWHMINSMTVEFNNQNIVQQTPFLNVFRSFCANTSFSQDDLLNEGYTTGFHPDTAGSWFYAPTSTNTNPLSTGGVGFCNNRQAPVVVSVSPITDEAAITQATTYYSSTAYSGIPTNTTGAAGGVLSAQGSGNPSPFAWSGYSQNEGFAIRTAWNGYDPVNTSTGQGLVNSAATCSTVYRSYKQTQTIAGIVSWDVNAKLRLKDLADYFNKCPLLKGSTMRFYINTNQASTQFTITKGAILASGAVDTYSTLVVNNSTVLGGLTQPLMVASADIGQGCSPLLTGTDGIYTLSVSIVKNTSSGLQTAMKSCRLYAPVYKMNPLAEQRYLSLAPTKKIVYNDIFQYQFNGIGANAPFNLLVTNGIQDIQSVLVVPFLSPTGNATTFSTLLSPTATSGATPDPITLTNFNILVSGVNLFLNNEQYDFEAFNQELKSSNQLNGNLTTGLASGLISEDMFSRCYRYYYGDCSRILPSEAGVSRSIQIQGTNASLLECNLMVFVEFRRSMTIDISTGARID